MSPEKSSFPSQVLVDVTMGRTPADAVILSGRWLCVQSGEIIPGTDIAIKDGRIAYVGPDARHTIGQPTKVYEAEDRFLVPGLLDGHMHVESGMLTVTEFVRAVIPHGTTGMFIDPHEIANVFGLRGVRLMVDEARNQPIHVWVEVPSCVPSAPGFETPGASLTPDDVVEALQWEGVIGLGEVMNFPGVINGDVKMHSEMDSARQAGKVIGGHYASPDLSLPFHGYVAGGPEDDHEGTRLEDAAERVRQGMRPMLRFGSAWHDVDQQIRAITELGMDPRRFILCTDDSHSETLVSEGHVNRAVKRAISRGVSPMTAYQMVTLNTADHFGLQREIGMIAPGRHADILVVRDLVELQIDQVFGKGKLLAENGKLVTEIPGFAYPEWVKSSVKLGRRLSAQDFRLRLAESLIPPSKMVTVNVIGVVENQAPTRHLRLSIPVKGQELTADIQQDLAKIALLERHQGTGRIQLGLVNGFGFNSRCAVGTTVAHDSHHMIVIGTSDEEMALAANQLADMGGGQVVVRNGEVIGMVDLPIAGLMSDERAEIVAQKAASILAGFRACGSNLNNPNMQMSLLALVVIPEIRISDLGLVDVTRFEFIPLIDH
jgi:adenine deaminase